MSDQITAPRRAGRVGPHRESHEPRLNGALFLATTALAGYMAFDVTSGQTDWGMDFNDQFSCCGAAATDHAEMAQTGSYGQYAQLGLPKFEGTLGTYGAYGKAMGFTPLVPSPVGPIPDQGVDNASWFAFLYKAGIISGYAEVPLDCLDWYAKTFLGAVTGLSINDQQAIADFEAVPRRPWDVMYDETGGHDVLYVKSPGDGSGDDVTWAGLQGFTLAFRNHNIMDAWVIMDPDDPNVDGPALRAALLDVHGTVAPTGPTGPTGGHMPRPAAFSDPVAAIHGA